MTVFNGAAPNARAALALDMEEVEWWSLAGAKGLTLLTARERLDCALAILVASCLYVIGD